MHQESDGRDALHCRLDVLKIPEDKRAQYTAILEEEKTSKKTI